MSLLLYSFSCKNGSLPKKYEIKITFKLFMCLYSNTIYFFIYVRVQCFVGVFVLNIVKRLTYF